MILIIKKNTKRIPVIISAVVAAAIIIAVFFLINNSPFYADWSDGYTFRGNSDTVLDERISEEIRQILNGDILMRRQYGISASDVGVGIPGVVYNTGGYDSVQTLRMFEGMVQIYLPDMKYALSQPAGRYSAAPDYPETAKKAILEMFRQTGSYVVDDDGILQRGVIIRHLILPDNLENTYRYSRRVPVGVLSYIIIRHIF